MTETVEYTLRLEERPGYLYAFVTGREDTLDACKEYWTRIHEEALELDVDRVVVEEDFPNQLTPMEMFQFGEFVKEAFGCRFKVAHVDRQLSDLDLNSFAETVAVNRGINVRIFSSFADAEKWIME